MEHIHIPFTILCAQADKIMENRIFEALSIKEKMQLKIHFLSCKKCRIINRKSKIFESALSEWFGKEDD